MVNPPIRLSRVVFPEPECPSITTNSPFSTKRLASCTAVTTLWSAIYSLCSFLHSIITYLSLLIINNLFWNDTSRYLGLGTNTPSETLTLGDGNNALFEAGYLTTPFGGFGRYENHLTQTKRVPFYIYLPDDLKQKEPTDTTLASSHKDIFPTLYNSTLYAKSYTALGTNLLDKNTLHCGFNDVGVIMAKNGGFKDSKAITDEEKKCQEYYKASLAVTEYLIKSNKK